MYASERVGNGMKTKHKTHQSYLKSFFATTTLHKNAESTGLFFLSFRFFLSFILFVEGSVLVEGTAAAAVGAEAAATFDFPSSSCIDADISDVSLAGTFSAVAATIKSM